MEEQAIVFRAGIRNCLADSPGEGFHVRADCEIDGVSAVGTLCGMGAAGQ